MRRDRRTNIHRRPELSQHQLRDANVAGAVVRRLRLPSGTLVVEPGAGSGILTQALVDAGARVIAIEKDERLFAELKSRFSRQRPPVHCVCADVLELELPRQPYWAVSNVPYGITAALVRRLLHAARPPDVAWLIVQREAAEKFAGTPRETLFSLLHKPWFDIAIAGALPAQMFVPQPRVRSALLRINRRAAPLLSESATVRYRSLTTAAFTHGLRPGLRRALTARQIRRLAHDHYFDAGAPASHLSFDQWLAIFRFVEHECLGHDPTLHSVAA